MIDRRHVLIALGGMLGSTALTACGQNATDADIALPNIDDLVPLAKFYTNRQFDLLSEFADALLPTSDSPGALEAGVPDLMTEVMILWANDSTQDTHRSDWAAIDSALEEISGADPLSLSKEAFFDALDALDEAHYGETAQQASGAIKASARAYKRQKDFVVLCYYMTEAGATQELQYEIYPGEIIRSATVEEIGRTWAL